MRAACPSYIGRPGKQPAGSIQAESAPKVGYRGVGERLEAVEHGSYAPDGPLGARKHSSVSRLLEPFTTWTTVRREVSRSAGLGGVPRRENQRKRITLRPWADSDPWFGAVGGGIVTAVPGAGSTIFGDVDVHLGPEGNRGKHRADAMGEPVRRVAKRMSGDGGDVVNEHGLRPGIRLVGAVDDRQGVLGGTEDVAAYGGS